MGRWTDGLKADIANMYYALMTTKDILGSFPELLWAALVAIITVSVVVIIVLWMYVIRLPTRTYRALRVMLARSAPYEESMDLAHHRGPPLREAIPSSPSSVPVEFTFYRPVSNPTSVRPDADAAIVAAAPAPARTDANSDQNPNPNPTGKCAHLLDEGRYCKRLPCKGKVYCYSHLPMHCP